MSTIKKEASNYNQMLPMNTIQDLLRIYSNNSPMNNVCPPSNEINVYIDFSFKLVNGFKIIKKKSNIMQSSLLTKRNHKESIALSSNKRSQSIYNAYKDDKQNIELFSRSHFNVNNNFEFQDLVQTLNKVTNKIKVILVFEKDNYVSQIIPTIKEEIEEIVKNQLDELADDFNYIHLESQIEYLKQNMNIKIHKMLFNNSSIGMRVLLKHLASDKGEVNLEAIGVMHLFDNQVEMEPQLNRELLLSAVNGNNNSQIFNTPALPKKATKKKSVKKQTVKKKPAKKKKKEASIVVNVEEKKSVREKEDKKNKEEQISVKEKETLKTKPLDTKKKITEIKKKIQEEEKKQKKQTVKQTKKKKTKGILDSSSEEMNEKIISVKQVKKKTRAVKAKPKIQEKEEKKQEIVKEFEQDNDTSSESQLGSEKINEDEEEIEEIDESEEFKQLENGEGNLNIFNN